MITNTRTTTQTIKNINFLLPELCNKIDTDTKNEFSLKYSYFVANNYQEERRLAREFLLLIKAEDHISEDLRSLEIEQAINNLLFAHRGTDNFYNEPSFAKQLLRVVGNNSSKIPKIIKRAYVLAIVEVFITNGWGVARSAEPIYIEMIKLFDPDQANIAVLAFDHSNIDSKLSTYELCKTKYQQMLKIIKTSVISPAILSLIEKIESKEVIVDNLKTNKYVKAIVEKFN
jgi:hypothetical protein